MNMLSQPVHQSWLFACFFFGVVVGVVVSFWLQGGLFTSAVWLLCGAILAVVGLWRRATGMLIVMVVAGGLVGVWRGGGHRQQLEVYGDLVGQAITLRGTVAEDADISERGDTVLRLKDIEVGGDGLAGSVWVSLKNGAAIKRSDIVILQGKAADGFGSFPVSMHRAELIKVERPVPGDIALRLRDWFADGVRLAVPEPEASLGVGYLVGQRRALPEELDRTLRATGLTHIVVASGYNLTILVGASRRLLLKVSKFLAAFLSSGMTVGFVLVTGMSPSMSRAGLVTGLSLLAWYYGRQFHPLVLLPLAAAVTLLINPSYGQGDLGWQLSFASFAGVLIVAPLLQDYFFGVKRGGVVRQIFFETTCAWLCTVPLIILAFGQFSNVAVVANLLVLPLIPLAMLLTFVAGVMALIVPAAAGLAGMPATLVLEYMTWVVGYLGGVPWAETTIEAGPGALVVYCLLLIAACLYIWRKTRYSFLEAATDIA